jgi:Fur family transcriptional regulator, ferric uptake regulator
MPDSSRFPVPGSGPLFATQLHLWAGFAAMPPMSNMSDFHKQARERLAGREVRVTRARCAVLATLLASARPLSHHELESQLSSACDRVTLYRVLAWLVEQRLAHRVSGEDRVWRFSVDNHANHRHAHFHCSACGMVFCMDATTRPPALPEGFRLDDVELTLRGTCPECAP